MMPQVLTVILEIIKINISVLYIPYMYIHIYIQMILKYFILLDSVLDQLPYSQWHTHRWWLQWWTMLLLLCTCLYHVVFASGELMYPFQSGTSSEVTHYWCVKTDVCLPLKVVLFCFVCVKMTVTCSLILDWRELFWEEHLYFDQKSKTKTRIIQS